MFDYCYFRDPVLGLALTIHEAPLIQPDLLVDNPLTLTVLDLIWQGNIDSRLRGDKGCLWSNAESNSTIRP